MNSLVLILHKCSGPCSISDLVSFKSACTPFTFSRDSVVGFQHVCCFFACCFWFGVVFGRGGEGDTFENCFCKW